MIRPGVLSIAGFDPSSGAGVTADIKTIEQHKAYGYGVVSALTFQNSEVFEDVKWVPVDEIIKQVEVLLRKESFAVVKIGLIESFTVLSTVVNYLVENIPGVKIIWDPILKASAGFDFHSDASSELLKNLWSKLLLVTPNIPEAQKMFNSEVLQINASSLGTNVLLKGGHGEGCYITDLLFAVNGEVHDFHGERFKNNPKHGTGCILSAAIASNLALGKSLPESCELSKAYVEKVMMSNESLLAFHTGK